MRIIDVPDLPPGAKRVYHDGYPLPEGSGTIVGSVGDLTVGRGPSTLAIYRGRPLRTLMRLDRPFRAALANDCAVVFIAIEDGASTELVRWDLDRAFVEPLARLPGKFKHICASPDGTRVALFDGRNLVVRGGALGDAGWSRELKDAPTVDHFAFDGDKVAFFRSWYDPDEPETVYIAIRVPETGDLEVNRQVDGSEPDWFARADTSVGNSMYSSGPPMLALSPDRSRAATSRRGWKLPSGEYESVRNLESWTSLSFSRRVVEYEANAIAYDTRNELWRISTAYDELPRLETCHSYDVTIHLPKLTHCALLPGEQIGVVIADGNEVKLGHVNDKAVAFETLIHGAARAIVCSDVIAVDIGGTTHTFDANGRSIATFATPSPVCAVANGGLAVACAGAIVRKNGVEKIPDANRIAFSEDGSRVAYATPYGFVVGGTERRDLISEIDVLVFAGSLYTLGRDGTLTEWDL